MTREINEVVMVSACRTAIGSFLGGLKDVGQIGDDRCPGAIDEQALIRNNR